MKNTSTIRLKFKWIGFTVGAFCFLVMCLNIITGELIWAGLMFICFVLDMYLGIVWHLKERGNK